MIWIMLIISSAALIFCIGAFIMLVLSQRARPTTLSDERREQFISIISHQLRTPLSIVRGYLEAVANGDLGKLTAKQTDYLKNAQAINEEMVTLVNTYLDALALDAANIPLKKSIISMNALIKKITNRFSGFARASNVTIETQLPKKSISLLADERLLTQVLENVISNAIKYSLGSGLVTITLEQKNALATLTISDTGIGIPAYQQEQLFTRFFRAKNILHKSIKGSGLGLFIAKSYLTAMKGDITIRSTEGHGTQVTITLPITKTA